MTRTETPTIDCSRYSPWNAVSNGDAALRRAAASGGRGQPPPSAQSYRVGGPGGNGWPLTLSLPCSNTKCAVNAFPSRVM